MDEIIEQLLKLQEIDTLKAELEKKRALVPRRLEEERVHWDAAKAAVREHKERLQARERERRAAEREAEELEQTVLRYQVQLNSAKTNEEYRALLNQIAHTRERASQAEDRVLVAMEDIERLERELREAEAAEQKARQAFQERERELNALAASLDEGIAAKTLERTRVAESLDPALLRRYERILAGKEGLAVAVVENYVCGGCHGTLPPQTVHEIRKREKLYTCQSCGRIIVTRRPDR